MANRSFDPVEFIRKPQVMLRIASWVFAVIVFACISAGGYYNHYCQMNNSGACSYGIGIGVFAFLVCIAFLIIDGLFENISNIQHRKYAILSDLVATVLITLLWFVGFCYMTDQWRRRNETPVALAPHDHGRDNVQAALAFSFFSIITWVSLVIFAFRRYRTGTSENFSSDYPQNQPTESAPYSSFPGTDAGDPYQQAAFANPRTGDTPDYNAPIY